MDVNANARVLRFRPSHPSFSNTINQRVELVRRFPLFAEIPLEDCAKIVAPAQERQLPRGKTIFFQGDPVRQVLFLTSGCIKISQLGASGQEVILRLIGPGENVSGESCATCTTHCSTARTMEPSTALAWETKTFQAVAANVPILLRNIWCDLQRQMSQLEERYREISTQKVAPRLSRELVRLVTQVGRPSDGHVEIALSQRELAQLTGTTLFTVSRLLCQWEEQGIVKPRREAVLVMNVAALVDMSAGE